MNGFKSNKRMQSQQNAGMEIRFIYEERMLASEIVCFIKNPEVNTRG